MLGDLGHRQPVQVPQGEGDPLIGRHARQGRVGRLGLHPLAPRVIEHGLFGDREGPLLPRGPTPVIDELVTGHPHQRSDSDPRRVMTLRGLDGRHEGLGRQVLGDGSAAAARQEVSIDLRQRTSVDRRHRIGA
jgi:hypothetical protein